MRSLSLLSATLLGLIVALPAAADTSATPSGLSLELIMQDPDWIGTPAENAYWSDDGRQVIYDRKRAGSLLRDWYTQDLDGGAPQRVADDARSTLDAAVGVFDAGRTRKAWVRNGDLFVKYLANGVVHQVTRTGDEESEPLFLRGRDMLAFQRGGHWYAVHLGTGALQQLSDLRSEEDPAAESADYDFIRAQQLRLQATVKRHKDQAEQLAAHERALQAADPRRPALPVYLGTGLQVDRSLLSPDGKWLLAIVSPKSNDGGKQDLMPNYVTRSGYVETRNVRRLVGRNSPVANGAILVELATGKQHRLDAAQLPGIKDDPFKGMRAGAVSWHVKQGADRAAMEKQLAAPAQRAVRVEAARWNDAGNEIAVRWRSVDNKDRWLTTWDFGKQALVTQHRLTDPAWINWDYNEFGWLPESSELWYLSEESGYSHLYTRDVGKRRTRQLTRGEFEVSAPVADKDGSHFYFLANVAHPGQYQVHRVELASARMERLTSIGARSEHLRASGDGGLTFGLSPDESRLLFKHDSPTMPPELYVQDAQPGAEAKRLTHTVSERFAALKWQTPELVAVPSTYTKRPVYARVFTPRDYDPSRKYPAVMFVHGAGYLQNAHQHWSVYFRENMFHNILAERGYVVIDMDFRASQGYGRDWRTAIYRQMGTPELEDFRAGVDWLVKNRAVDPARVGVYGGSYGGFMVFMALFKDPDLFAAGAALRPVTDWAHYNHPYTSNILNTPELDPVAYEVSSPLEHVEGLKKPLLFAHGMQDDNVFYKDSVRLVQRLIELKKEDWELASYPLDAHAFANAESWLDEYRRIWKLFETHLKD